MAGPTHDVELELDKLLGFKRVAAFGNDSVKLARTLNATYNKVGEVNTGSSRCTDF
jgi:hypothetical protein